MLCMQTKNVQKNRKISKKVYVKKTFSLTPPIKESKIKHENYETFVNNTHTFCV